MKLRNMKYSAFALMAYLCLVVIPASAAEERSRNWIRFQTWGADSLKLFASYYPAQLSELPFILMLHDRGGIGADFGTLATRFSRAGMPVFLPDLRGEGQSTEQGRITVAPAPRWGSSELPILVKDMDGIFSFANAQEGSEARSWIVVTAGEAAGIALALAESNESVSGVVLLSPLGLDREFDLASTEVPIYLLACDSDEESADLVRSIYRWIPQDKRRMDIMSCRSRGHRMLRWVGDLGDRIVEWTMQLPGESP